MIDRRTSDARAVRVVAFFESISPESVARLGEVYTADAFFKDPFNEVQGVPAIEKIFAHMFVAVDRPRFVVHDVVVQGDQAFLTWDFLFHMRRLREGEQRVRGASQLRFAADGRVAMHRDYWDAAEELYEKLPVLGALMRLLKRQARR